MRPAPIPLREPSSRPRRNAAAIATVSLASLASLALLAGLVVGCGGSSDATSSSGASTGSSAGAGTKLALVAYSTPQTAYDALIARYQRTPAGHGISFGESFGASGAQSRAVDSGQPADVVAFSTTPDITRLVKSGIVAGNWNANPHKGIVTNSVVALVVRTGNPKHITGWDDLVKPGIQVITPNPSTSGSARWNVLAAYGAQLKEGRTPAQAQAYLSNLITKHVKQEDTSGRGALQTFTGGAGDVLISYENEAIGAQQKGLAVDYLIPRQTILIEAPIAVTSKSAHATQANAFVNWLWTPAAQAVWAHKGYRPVLASLSKQYARRFPTPPQLFTIKFLGGWTTVGKKFFDPAAGLVTKIEQAGNFPTASS